jgi:hypothetical protein
MLEEFLKLASINTQNNLETCGVLTGYLVSSFNIPSESQVFLRYIPFAGSTLVEAFPQRMVYSQCVLFPEKGCLQHYDSHHPQTKINTRYSKSLFRNSCTHLVYLLDILATVDDGLGGSYVCPLVCPAILVCF